MRFFYLFPNFQTLTFGILKLEVNTVQSAYVSYVEFSSPDTTKFNFVFHSTPLRVSIALSIFPLSQNLKSENALDNYIIQIPNFYKTTSSAIVRWFLLYFKTKLLQSKIVQGQEDSSIYYGKH